MTPRRVLVVGWDGATWDAIDPLLAARRLPHLAALLDGGVRAELQSTVPPVTPAAWTSMATGQAPGRTGVLGFRHLDLRRASGFDPRLAGSADLRGRTLFEHAAALGAGVAMAAYPMTWPPFPVPGGVLLSGWPRPETARAPMWPESEAQRESEWGQGPSRPSSTARTRDGRMDPVAAAIELDERTLAVGLRWLRERDDALVFVGLQGTDHLAHRYWGRPELDACYERFDRWLGELQQAAGPEAATVIVSDHGFGPGPTAQVHLGRALADAGLLQRRAASAPSWTGRASRAVRERLPKEHWKRLRDRLPGAARRWGFERALDAAGLDPSGTRVTRVPLYENYDGLVVQVRGRQRGGVVAPEDWLATREAARRAVLAIEDDRGAVAVRVLDREAVWSGPALPGLPDLVVELRDDLRAGDRLDAGPIVEPIAPSPGEGSHRRAGIFAARGPGIRSTGQSPAPIEPWDVLPTALALVGVGCPVGIDGAPRVDLLDAPPPPAVPRAGGTPKVAPSESANAGLERSLRELGYLS